VKLGEAWWNGRDQAFENELIKHEPPCLDSRAMMKSAQIVTGMYKEGIAFKASVIKGWQSTLGPYWTTWRLSMEAEIAASESRQRAQASIDSLRETVTKFSAEIKNDLSSMKAASQRVQTEAAQMRERYTQAQAILTSPEFERAIENAERMAVALKSLSELSATNLNVSVLAAATAPGK